MIALPQTATAMIRTKYGASTSNFVETSAEMDVLFAVSWHERDQHVETPPSDPEPPAMKSALKAEQRERWRFSRRPRKTLAVMQFEARNKKWNISGRVSKRREVNRRKKRQRIR